MAAEITITPTFQATAPKLLFRVPGAGRLTSPDAYYSSASIARDGQQFAFAVAMAPARNIVLVALETLATYVGRYVAAGDGEELVVTLEDDQLTLQLQERKLRLFAESETYFFGREFPIGDFDIEFVKDGAGAVTAVLTYFGGPGSRWVRQ